MDVTSVRLASLFTDLQKMKRSANLVLKIAWRAVRKTMGNMDVYNAWLASELDRTGSAKSALRIDTQPNAAGKTMKNY